MKTIIQTGIVAFIGGVLLTLFTLNMINHYERVEVPTGLYEQQITETPDIWYSKEAVILDTFVDKWGQFTILKYGAEADGLAYKFSVYDTAYVEITKSKLRRKR